MTQIEYSGAVTTAIDEATSGFEYPASFDSDVSACFARRLSVEDAVAKLLQDYTQGIEE